MVNSIYFAITNNCNLECAHCFRDSGPGKKNTTISYENFQRVIDNLPKEDTKLTLTGGEIFTEKDKLYGFLEYLNGIKEKYNFRGGKYFEIVLQTNAFWAINESKIEEILREIDGFGVNELDVTSDDDYHYAQGIKSENLGKLKHFFWDTRSSFENIVHVDLRGAGVRIMPIGRGKKFEKDNEYINFHSCGNNLNNSRLHLTVNEIGEVFPCCFGVFPLEGNLIEQPLQKIVENALKNPKISALNVNGICELARKDGWDARELEAQIDTLGECGFCYHNYIKNGLHRKIRERKGQSWQRVIKNILN